MKPRLINRFLAIVLSFAMIVVLMPSSAFAATTTTASDTTSTNVAKVQSYAAQLRDANTASSTSGGFSWDTEKKNYSWTYFNGLMLDAFNMIGGSDNTSYADTFYNANIGTDGKWVSSATYGACDSVEPIRAVFDILATSSNKEKYQKGIQYVYTMLESKTTYSNCGGNFKHLESSTDSYAIMLDGVYMVEPFLMECANAIDAGNLTLKSGTDGNGDVVTSAEIRTAVYNRFEWIYDAMYDSTTGLYYHAYNPSGNKTNGYFWSRSIGWYAMALVDTIEMMPDGEQKTTLEGYLPRLFDGLLKWQDADTGMWYNVPNYGSDLKGTYSNQLETSGTSMFAYAMMKAYNNGWVSDSKYAEAGLKAFNGVVANEMSGSEGSYSVSGTYLKSGVCTSATGYLTYAYTTNEAKGVGALIMASTLANATAKKLAGSSTTDPAESETTAPESLTDTNTGVTVSGSKATAITVSTSTNTNVATAVSSILDSGYTAYDFTLTGYTEGTETTVKFPIPSTVTDTSKFAVYYVPESGDAEKMSGSVITENDKNYYQFKTTHFSTYVGGVLTSSGNTDSNTDTTTSKSSSGNLAVSTTSQGSYTAVSVTLTTSNYKSYANNGYYYKSNNNYYLITDISTRSSTNHPYKISYSNTSSNVSESVTLYVASTAFTKGDSVTLSVTPSSATLNAYNNETTTLKASVTVGDSATTATSSTITWSSDDTAVATVDASTGVVTSVAKGTANITATLTKANGSDIYGTSTTTGSISVSIPITVTYVEKKTPLADYTYDSSLTDAISYPEYPEDGAVRIDKTATSSNFDTTGVANVELDAAGVSVNTGIDIVLVLDVSNSMAWSLENSGYTNDYQKVASSGQTKKITYAKQAMESLTKTVLAGNSADGTDASDNTVSLVTFAGYDEENWSGTANSYADSVTTIFSGYTVYSKAYDLEEAVDVTGTVSGTTSSYTLSYTDSEGNVVKNQSNRGDTNYDYGFAEATAAVNAIQKKYSSAYAAGTRQTYVLFMTDGAASNYQNKYYGASNSYYLYGDHTATYTATNYRSDSTNGKTNWYNYISTTKNDYAETLYNLVGGNMQVIGFDLDHGGFNSWSWSATQLKASLAQMVDGATLTVNNASDADSLTKLYNEFAVMVAGKSAGTKAQVTDTINSSYTLQMGSTAGDGTGKTVSGVSSDITVKAYDLYTKKDASTTSQIGTRKATSDTNPTILETVSFNDAGTEAYSSVLGSDNIMTKASDGSVKIDAYYFTYTKDTNGTEKFVWKIGDITDKEVALSYYVYLKGALEGTATQGIYNTNESAKLDYIDVNGYKAEKTFPVPALAWGGASTAYEFYLVNEDGEPVNHNGVVVPFANRVIVSGPTYTTLNLNQSESVSASVKAADVLPDGYVLLDDTAAYTVTTAGGSLKGYLTTTGKATEVVSFDSSNYTQSRVAFGVIYNKTPIYTSVELNKHEIVVDYGKAIEADILSDDVETITLNSVDYTRSGIAGFVEYNASANLKKVQSKPSSATYDSGIGIFSVDSTNNKVKYQLYKMLSTVDTVFCVVEYANSDKTDSIYLYEELDVIPATIMYYETNFSDVITKSSDMTQKTDNGTTVTGGTTSSADGIQNDGTVGTNTYGFDTTYQNDNLYSDGSSYFIENKNTDSSNLDNVAEFTFTGTGFDLISRTGAEQGLIRATIYKSDKTTKVKTVTVANKSESKLELYQIPVISVNGLVHDTYYVTISVFAPYKDATYDSLYRGGEFYFDALRIYDPIDVSGGSSCTGAAKIAYDAYVEDGESTDTLTELRSMLLSEDEAAELLDVEEGVLYVDRTQSGVKLATYETIGPDNEVYLTDNTDGAQAIAFALDISDGIPSSIDIGAKSADENKAVLHVTVYDANGENVLAEISQDLNSSTVEFYDIFNGKAIASTIGNNDSIYVTVDTDSDSGILSVTDLKVAYGNTPSTASITSTASLAKMVMNLYAAEDETTQEVNCDVTSASFTSAKVVRNKTATLTVVTGSDAESLTVLNKAGKAQNITTSSVDNGDGTKTWTVTFKVTATGTQTYTVTGFDTNGNSGTSATASIKVTLR